MAKNSEYIKIRGARQHNLKNIDLDIPKNKLIVFTGVSGSGKSSLAFDTIYAEGQRRYVESLSTYARQFLGIMKKPDVDLIEGLSPAISIDQKTVSRNPRSTVGTVTEVYDYLRLLFARVGHPHCPVCGGEIASQSIDQIVESVYQAIKIAAKQNSTCRFLVLSPLVKDRKGEFSALLDNLKAKGFRRIRIDREIRDLEEDIVLIKTNKHTIEVIVDRISITSKDLKDKLFQKNFISRLTDSIEQSLKLSDGLVIISKVTDPGFEMPENPKNLEDHLYSERFACAKDNINLPEIEPRTFSFNSPHGACPRCFGIGYILKVRPDLVFAEGLTIKEGGIIPFSYVFEYDTWFARLILKFCAENEIDVHTPISKLTKKQRKLILYGTDKKKYRVEGRNKQGKWTYIYQAFPGIVGELENKLSSTESDYVKSTIQKYMIESICPECKGTRLKKEALSITIDKKSISDVSGLSIQETLKWLKDIQTGKALSKREKQIAELVLKEIIQRLIFLKDVGLSYLTIDRSAATLAGGESQRIRLASQIGSGLAGVLYVLDEPTIGLHARDNSRLIATLKKMRDLGNTIIVVEHDRDIIDNSDYVYDFGPGGGHHGGSIIAQGAPKQLRSSPSSLTGKYLGHKRKINFPKKTFTENESVKILGASQFNLKNIDCKIPLNKFIVVTGVSGSGKSTLVVETLYHAIAKKLNPYHKKSPGKYEKIVGLENIRKVILIDQSPIGRTPRSNPATYTKVFDVIRDVFANTRQARAMGFKKGRFSFNVRGGRCEACEGQGKNKIEMQFMADIWVNCEICKGTRYNTQTLEVTYKAQSIADILAMSVEEALEFFHVYKPIVTKLETLKAVGLDYMELGQPATTLSGGEAQRVKLASELSKKTSTNSLIILDEPTTGLHFSDLEKLMNVLKALVERGNTVIVIEHNLDVIKNADWIIDLGPEGGDLGGHLVAQGTPEAVARSKASYTGFFLKKTLKIS